MPAFITGIGACLPNEPVTNDRMEAVLGSLNGHSSRVKDVILKRNGIRSRYYAIDPQTGRQTHSNAQMTAEAIRDLADRTGFALDQTEVLACGTSTPDQLVPSHASMVHGLIGCPPCDIASTSGVCCSGVASLKYGYLNVIAGQARNAVVTGSELTSTLWAARYIQSQQASNGSVEEEPYLAFDNEFLRWMLSDGAAAMLIESEPRSGALSLRIDWIDVLSFANELETCMYWGGIKDEDGSLRSWRSLENIENAWSGGYFIVGQDVRLLKENILPVAMRRSFETTVARRGLKPEAIDWVLPHLSSYFFEKPIKDSLAEIGFHVPPEKWMTNLDRKGNTGAASIYLMLEELCSSGRLRPGQRVLCAIPESARFTFAYIHLTVA
jgi:3-oxoacyl-[acyl-carrier-protein] synthase-3